MITAKEVYLNDLFSTKFLFEIPNYQRPFAWSQEQFEQLFEDVKDSITANEPNYFLGSVVLQILEERPDGSGRYDVVDGQQRLTTLTLLLAVLRDLAVKLGNKDAGETLQKAIYQEANEWAGTPEAIKLKVADRMRTFFEHYVYLRGGTLLVDTVEVSSEAEQHAKEALLLFRSKLQGDGDNINGQLVFSLIKFLLQQCMFVYIKADTLTAALRLFTVLNTRGLSLTTSDILKAENLRAISEVDRQRYSDIWESVESDIGRDHLESLIAHIRTIKVKDKSRKNMRDAYAEQVFKPGLLRTGKEFIEYLNKMAKLYSDKVLDANLGSDLPEKEVGFHNLMCLLRDHFPTFDWTAAFLACCEKFPGAVDRAHFLNALERRIAVDWILGRTPAQRETRTFEVLRAVEAASDINSLVSSPALSTATDELTLRTSLDVTDFYARPFAKYVLLRLELSSWENRLVRREVVGRVTLEHVLPRTPAQGSDWANLFTEGVRTQWTNRLGNLVLLSRQKNSSANNRPFVDKLRSYYRGGKTEFALTQELEQLGQWGPDQLTKRHADLLDRAVKVWIS